MTTPIPKNRIKEERELSRLSQRELAMLLGIDMTTVSKHENSERAIPEPMIAKYAAVFKTETHKLFYLKDM